jgi:hypothetical protein
MSNCLECGTKLMGRVDKKFCHETCRNAFNNKLNKDTSNLMRSINNRLRKNHRILSEINLKDKTKVSKLKLLSKNFDFELFTSIYTTKANKTYYFVYDQGYILLEDDSYLLVKRES